MEQPQDNMVDQKLLLAGELLKVREERLLYTIILLQPLSPTGKWQVSFTRYRKLVVSIAYKLSHQLHPHNKLKSQGRRDLELVKIVSL